MTLQVRRGTLVGRRRDVLRCASRSSARCRSVRRVLGVHAAPLGCTGLQGVFSSHDNLSTVLAPYLHGERYTSYDRHFTERALLETVANR